MTYRCVSQRLYIQTMKRCLTNWIYGKNEPNWDAEKREQGLDWPVTAHTMIGLRRLDNIEDCWNRILEDEVPGDLMETGVWRGGAVIFMRALLAAWDDPDRRVWAADSFQGLPPPDPSCPGDQGDRHHTYSYLAVGLDEVKRNFQAYGLLDDRTVFLPGWFKDTLPSAPIRNLALLRLDGDMYGSTSEAIRTLYPKLSRGGFLIVDDWSLPGAHQAVVDYRKEAGIEDPIQDIDCASVYWRKGTA